MKCIIFSIEGIELLGSTKSYAVDVQVKHEGHVTDASCTVIEYYDANGDHYTWEMNHVEPPEMEDSIQGELCGEIIRRVVVMDQRETYKRLAEKGV